MATTPDRPNLNDNAEQFPPSIRHSRREQQRAAQAREALMQAYGREDSEEEQGRVQRIAHIADRFENGLGEIDDNDEVVMP